MKSLYGLWARRPNTYPASLWDTVGRAVLLYDMTQWERP